MPHPFSGWVRYVFVMSPRGDVVAFVVAPLRSQSGELGFILVVSLLS